MGAVFAFIKGFLAWAIKDAAQIIGVVEAIGKAVAGIVSLTPTKKDDFLIAWVDKAGSAVKKALYWASDKLAGKL
jgi:hypothetical protein